MNPLWKIPLILVCAVSTHICMTPPNPPARKQEKTKFEEDAGAKDVVPVTLITPTWKTLTQLMRIVEVLAILMQEGTPVDSYLRPLISTLFPEKHLPSSIRITPTFLVGVMLLVAASSLRIICYRHLGRHFTFELSLHEEHKLITDGPYAVVRHPSYTALFIYFAGSALTFLGEGSWWAEYGVMYGLGRISGMVVVATLTTWVLFFLTRVRLEDQALASNFKEQWSRWSVQTPYKLLPLIY